MAILAFAGPEATRSCVDPQVQRTALVGGGVRLTLLRRQLGELVALRVAPYTAGLVGQVDLEAVPRELPHHGDGHHRGPVGARAHAHGGRSERPGDAADGALVVGRVEHVERALHLELRVGRDGPDVARRPRRLRHGRGRRLGLLWSLVVQIARALARVAQALEEGAPAALVARVVERQVVGPRLADPALVLGARGAQVAHRAALPAGQEVLGVLAAQQGAPAHVAGDVQLVGLDVAGARHEVPRG